MSAGLSSGECSRKLFFSRGLMFYGEMSGNLFFEGVEEKMSAGLCLGDF